MSKGNPIIGLAYVVTSQQEMLEEANKKNDELTKEYMELLKEKEQLEYTTFNCERGDIPMHEVEAVFRIYEGRIKELIEQCNDIKSESDAKIEELKSVNNMLDDGLKKAMEDLQNAKDQEKYFSGEYNRVNHINLDLSLQLDKERKTSFHWQKWTADKEYPLNRFGNVPMVDGLYLFHDDSTQTEWIENDMRHVPMAGTYNIDGVIINTPIELKDRGVFSISPNNNKDRTLVAVCMHDYSEAMLLDEMPEVMDGEEENKI